MKPTFLFILFSFAWIIVSKTGLSQDRFEIDDEGNIILIEEKNPKPESPKIEAEKVKIAPAPEPKPEPAPEPAPSPAPAPQPTPTPIPAPSSTTTSPAETSAPDEAVTRFPFQASVVTRTAPLKALASDESRNIVLLRQGDRLEIIGQENSYLRARYLLEGQFPVEGWIQMDNLDLSANSQVTKPKEQAYKAPNETRDVVTEVQNFPNMELTEEVQLPQDPKISTRVPAKSNEDLEKTRPRLKKERDPESWYWRGRAAAGWSRYEEKISTAIADEDERVQFLDYSLDGFRLELEAEYYRFFSSYLAGFRANYTFSFYDSNISNSNTTIESSNVLAQLHQLSLKAFGSRSWRIKKYEIEPELSLGAQFQNLSVNQLRDKQNALPVLFSDLAFFMKMEFVPKLHSPYFLSLEPYLGAAFFYYFIEGPKQNTSAGVVQTGSPQISPFLLQYGATLVWDMEMINLPDQFLKLKYLYEDYSRNFSGEGNRAGMKMLDANSSVSIQSLSLGYEYRF